MQVNCFVYIGGGLVVNQYMVVLLLVVQVVVVSGDLVCYYGGFFQFFVLSGDQYVMGGVGDWIFWYFFFWVEEVVDKVIFFIWCVDVDYFVKCLQLCYICLYCFNLLVICQYYQIIVFFLNFNGGFEF